MSDTNIIAERLSQLGPLSAGLHAPDGIGCVMEATAFVAGEPWSDHPLCVCPVLGAFLRTLNDGLPDDAARDELLRPLIPRLIGTRGSAKLERLRAMMAADWLIRTHTVAWLRLAKLDKAANTLAALPEITDFAQCPSLMPALEAAKNDAFAARDAAKGRLGRRLGRRAARDAAWDAAGRRRQGRQDAARDAAWAPPGSPPGTSAWDAAWDAALDAAGTAARAAVRAAVRAAPGVRWSVRGSACSGLRWNLSGA